MKPVEAECLNCRYKSFNSIQDFNKHVLICYGAKLTDTNQDVEFVCNQCPTKWNSSEVLHYHLFLEHQVNEQVCDICGTIIKSTYYLEKHKKQVHLQLKEYQCKECPKVYASYEGLTRHVDLIHRKIKRFECEYCGYKTNCNNRLRNHTKTLHTKEPFLL
jgi:hypothetical protein